METTDSHPAETRFAEFRFYEELNDFLPAGRQKTSFQSPFHGTPSVKDVIQAIGVPHTEIDLVLVDGQSVVFSHRLRGGERVAVYPEFERLDISPIVRLRPRPLRDTRFILDVHLGKLARYLRMLGFNTAYSRRWTNATLIDMSLQQKRIILTRSPEILKQNRVTHGYWLRHEKPRAQVLEMLQALDLFSQVQPFTRCMDCNGRIHKVDKAFVEDQVNPRVFQRFDKFRQCRECKKIYWQGSHHKRMLALISELAHEHTGVDNQENK